MSANAPGAGDDRPATRSSGGSALRRPTAWLAAFGVVILLAAAFALSYDAFATLARAGGVNPLLARYYPGVFDATLVVAFAALFVLRTARVYVRLLTWLSAILVLAVCAAAGAAYLAGIHIPRQPLAAGVATAPFLLLVLAFRLWLTMLRHIRRGSVRRRGQGETRYADYMSPEPAAVGRGARSAPPLALPSGGPSERAGAAATQEPEADEPVRREAAEKPERGEPVREPEPVREVAEPEPVQPEPAYEDEPEPEFEPITYEAEPAPAAYELEPEFGDQPGDDADVRDEQAPADEPVEPTLDDLAAVVDFAELGEPVASLEPDENDLDENRPPLPRRQRIRPTAEFGEEDELVADEGPLSDPVSDEAESDDDLARANEADELDEFAEFESDDVPPPPSHRVRSSPLPPLDWGPGLGGLTGRRRTPRANGGSDTV